MLLNVNLLIRKNMSDRVSKSILNARVSLFNNY